MKSFRLNRIIVVNLVEFVLSDSNTGMITLTHKFRVTVMCNPSLDMLVLLRSFLTIGVFAFAVQSDINQAQVKNSGWEVTAGQPSC